MSNNLSPFTNSYDWLSNINTLDFEDKSVLVIGAGYMGNHHAEALSKMKIRDVTIFSRSKERAIQTSNKFGFNPAFADIEKCLDSIGKVDLTIIATPVGSLLHLGQLAIEHGQDNVLIEKPGSVYYQHLLDLNKILTNQRVRIGYNRLVYTNLHKLKKSISDEGGITSCNFTFTEHIHTIDFEKEEKIIYERWGISNSLHVISIALDLIGMPKQYFFYQSGKFDWHPSGSVFVGSGLSEKNIPFSYNSDWGSSGRWGIEIMTNQNAYRLISLEELFVCHKETVKWEKVDFTTAYPEVKQGVAEEIAIMLDKNIEKEIPLVSLEKAALFNQVAEKVFGYSNSNNRN